MEIPSSLRDIYKEAGDALIEFGRNDCTLLMRGTEVECPNCIINTFGDTSTNTYKSGGPIPFTGGVCPRCEGKGFINDYAEVAVKLNVYWTPKNWLQFSRAGDLRASIGGNIKLDSADGIIQIRGYIADLPNLAKADKLIIDNNKYGKTVFVRETEMIPYGFGGQAEYYCMGFWRRVG